MMTRRRRQAGQAMVEYAIALSLIALAFVTGARMMSGVWEGQLALMAAALSSDPIKTSF